MQKPQSVNDLSAVVTGMLLAFVCPANTPCWMILIGDFFAIIVVKQLFGGIGKNFLNPALAGRAALVASYAGAMTTWLPGGTQAGMGAGGTAGRGYRRHASGLYEDRRHGRPDQPDRSWGYVPGQGRRLHGRDFCPAADRGRSYLIWRKVISWQTPAAYIATVAVLTVLFPKGGGDNRSSCCTASSAAA